MRRNTLMGRRESGFTLIEILVALALVAILSAVAIPSYASYVMRGRLTEAFTALSAIQPRAEEVWSNTRSYETLAAPASPNFSYTVSATVSSYTVTATGSGPATGFEFTIDQNGNRATTHAPTGWTANNNCWIDRKGGQCVQ
jgi:type IV pilus assembly protein PilE